MELALELFHDADLTSIYDFDSLTTLVSRLIDIVFRIPLWSIWTYLGQTPTARYGSERWDRSFNYLSKGMWSTEIAISMGRSTKPKSLPAKRVWNQTCLLSSFFYLAPAFLVFVSVIFLNKAILWMKHGLRATNVSIYLTSGGIRRTMAVDLGGN